DGGMALVTVVVMLYYSWKLALMSLLAVAIYILIRYLSFRVLRTHTEQQLVAGAKQQSHLLESLRGMQSIKVAGEESQRRSMYANLMNETVNHDVHVAKLNLGFTSANKIVFGLERVAVVWVGALLALNGTFSVGMLIAYLAYKDQFSERVGALIDKCIEFR